MELPEPYEICLPPGAWFDYWTVELVTGEAAGNEGGDGAGNAEHQTLKSCRSSFGEARSYRVSPSCRARRSSADAVVSSTALLSKNMKAASGRLKFEIADMSAGEQIVVGN